MACLRSVLRRTSLSHRQFLQSMTVRHVLRNDINDEETYSLNSSPLTYGLQNQAHRLERLLVEKKHTCFARPVGFGFLLRRYMSSKQGEMSNKVEGFCAVAEEQVPEKSVEAVVTQVSTINEVAVAATDSSLPVAAIQYLIDSIHAFTGLNWWASIVLTTVLVRGLSLLKFITLSKIGPDCCNLVPRTARLLKMIETDDARLEKEWKAYYEENLPILSSCVTISFVGGVIYITSLAAIRNMAQKIPSFESGGILWFTDLTTPDTLHILPVMMGLTLWITNEKNLVAGIRRLPWWIFVSVAFHATFSIESAVYCFMIPSRMFTFGLHLVTLKVLKIKDLPVDDPMLFSQLSKINESIARIFKNKK